MVPNSSMVLDTIPMIGNVISRLGTSDPCPDWMVLADPSHGFSYISDATKATW
jgi:hypothetical protein